MSKSDVEQFYQQVLNNKELQEQLTRATDRDSKVALAVKLGKKQGLNFTIEDVEPYIDELAASSPEEELTDEQLEAVAGGWLTINGGCMS